MTEPAGDSRHRSVAMAEINPVRAWFSGHLYPEKPTGSKLNLDALEQKGITDVFLNEPIEEEDID